MSGHTPGPWTWGDGWRPETFGDPDDPMTTEKYADLRLLGAGGAEVIPLRIDHRDYLFDAPKSAEAIHGADRALIAAAPELLGALKAFVLKSENDWGFDNDVLLDVAKAAIAKAEPE